MAVRGLPGVQIFNTSWVFLLRMPCAALRPASGCPLGSVAGFVPARARSPALRRRPVELAAVVVRFACSRGFSPSSKLVLSAGEVER